MIYISNVLLLFSSPYMVDRSANLRVVSRHIAWGKYTYLAQTCMASDYILC